MSRGLGAVERELLASLRALTIQDVSEAGEAGEGASALERKLLAARRALTIQDVSEAGGGAWYSIERLLDNAYPEAPGEFSDQQRAEMPDAVTHMEEHYESLTVSWRRAARSLARKGLIERDWRDIQPVAMIIGNDLLGSRRFHVVRLKDPRFDIPV